MIVILKSLKKNQVIIYVIALMLVAAGYLNYTAGDNKSAIETSLDPEVTYNENVADIGDATLVNSNEVIEEPKSEDKKVDEDDYFTKSKLERDNMYSQMIETYQNIINSSTVSEEQRNIATQEISKINNIKNSIMVCENILSTKGLDKNVVFVNGEVVSIVVKVDGNLAENQVAQIQNVISREMKVEIENINITEK